MTAKSKDKDHIWELASIVDKGTMKRIPGWHGFNALTAVKKVYPATVRCPPFPSAPPAEMNTMYTSLVKLVAVADKLGQKHSLVTADLAIYSKAQKILRSKPELLVGKVTMQLGRPHHLMAFINSVGKLFGDGGVHQLLMMTGVYADAIAQLMLQGKQLGRAVRRIKLILWAMSHVFLKSAHTWAEQQGLPWIDDQTVRSFEDLQITFRTRDRDSATKIIDALDTSGVTETLQQFQTVGQAQSAAFRFWDNFMEAARHVASHQSRERCCL